jgi:hypothetical protein
MMSGPGLLLVGMALTFLEGSAWASTNEMTAQINSLFEPYDRPGAPGASVMVIKKGKPIFA